MNLLDDFLGKVNKPEVSITDETGAPEPTGDNVDATDKGPEPIPQPIKLEWSVTTESRNAVREASVEIDR